MNIFAPRITPRVTSPHITSHAAIPEPLKILNDLGLSCAMYRATPRSKRLSLLQRLPYIGANAVKSDGGIFSYCLLRTRRTAPAGQAGYPNESNFMTGGDNDAFWFVTSPSGTSRCSTNGLSFILYLQGILGVTQDAKWGTNTGNALVAALRTAGADDVIVQGVQGEVTLHQVGRVSLTTAIWLMLNFQATGSVPQGITLNQVELPSQLTLPEWDIAPQGSSFVGPPTCTAESTDATPSVPTTNTATDTGGNAPAIPTGIRDTIYQGGSSISWALIALLAVGLGVAYWLTSDLVSQSRRTRTTRLARRNPRHRRMRHAA